MKRLLKIGTLNLPAERWLDALNTFDEIIVVCNKSEKEVLNNKIMYMKFDNEKIINKVLLRLIMHFDRNRNLSFFVYLFMALLRFANRGWIKNIKSIKFDYVHSSYNDFDESALLTLLLKMPKYTRAQKETRLQYSTLELYAFLAADRIVFNAKENKDFFESKYGKIFTGKNIIYELDEDVRGCDVKNKINYQNKLSLFDQKIHAVILAGRVLSSDVDKRSGGRLYYIPLIKKLLKAGMVVHLHAKNIVKYNDNNPYYDLANENDNFIIEAPLDFTNDTINAYGILSRYDIGVFHARIPNNDVTLFDRVNIPHRYYEYQLAKVAPIEKRGENSLLDRKGYQKHIVLYENIEDISLSDIKEVIFENLSFKEYINHLYAD